ncbi:MAG: UvrD-helicase domain-containing protein [Planctomycetota bacterium]
MSVSQPSLFDTRATRDDGFAPTLIRASAGTGKTYQLTARYMQILLAGAAPETILATTFTRKAAGEILSRVLISLAQAAIEPESGALDSLRKQVQREGLSSKKCAELLHEVLQQIHRLRICTLDSLFSQLARALPFEVAMPPGWRLTDEVEESWMRQSAVSDLIDSLRPSETETLIAMLGRGDHKRHVARQLVQLIEGVYGLSRGADQGVWDTLDVPRMPDSASMTRAAGQLRSASLPQKSVQKQLNLAADHLDARDFGPLAGQTLIKNLHRARREGDVVKYGRSKIPAELDPALDVLYRCVLVEVRSLLRAQNHATGKVVSLYDHVIGSLKDSMAAFGFDDVASRLAAVFASVVPGAVVNRLDASIDHLLLDEFQDTSPVQWSVLRALAMLVTTDPTDDAEPMTAGRSFFCVGDTKQAIYGWRGGVAEIFDAVDREIPGVASLSQNESHRSSAVVLDTVTDAMQHLTRHPMADVENHDPASRDLYESRAIHQFAASFPTHTAAKDLPGYVRLETCRLPASDADRPTADQWSAQLAEDVGQRVASLQRRCPLGSVGVLTRTNAAASAMIEHLRRLEVDVSAEGGNPLVDSLAVRWILSALKSIEHPGDGRWALHVRHSPLASYLSNQDGELRDRLERDGIPETIARLAGPLMAISDDAECVRLEQLVELATLFPAIGRVRLCDFIEMVELKRVQRPRAAAVRVMTIHQSKGLEFDSVFLPELHKPMLGPSPQVVLERPDVAEPATGLSRSHDHQQWHLLTPRWQSAMGSSVRGRMTEAMCLLYVALTRAKHGLYLVMPPATKQDFASKTFASVLYHAWGCKEDPTRPGHTLFESGDRTWWQRLPSQPLPRPVEETQPIRLRFQPSNHPS